MRTNHMVLSPTVSNFSSFQNNQKWIPSPLLVPVRETVQCRVRTGGLQFGSKWLPKVQSPKIIWSGLKIKSWTWVKLVNWGLIGRSYAMIFASAGFNVRIYDIAQAQIEAALEDIASQLRILEKDGLIRGTLSVGIQWFFASVLMN